ncbi:unnamed protein product, partial [Protopolystoma xenopodis]
MYCADAYWIPAQTYTATAYTYAKGFYSLPSGSVNGLVT